MDLVWIKVAYFCLGAGLAFVIVSLSAGWHQRFRVVKRERHEHMGER
jgi:hypothetical protein